MVKPLFGVANSAKGVSFEHCSRRSSYQGMRWYVRSTFDGMFLQMVQSDPQRIRIHC